MALYIRALFSSCFLLPAFHSFFFFFFPLFLRASPITLSVSQTLQQPSTSNKAMRSALYYAGCDEQHYQPHFLDSCSLCQRPLAHDNDIFMYRGNTPFCSQECRQEQIEIDEANERRWKVSSSKRSNTNRNTSTDSRKESEHTNKAVRTGAVAVA